MSRAATRAAACLLLAGSAGLPGTPVAYAQPAAQERSAVTAAVFALAAHSSALLQARAAEIVSGRDARPEAKSFARQMLEFRRGQLRKLETAAAENKAATPPGLAFEHRVVIENLEPLDFLALSRRYAEMQVQALEQEVELYSGAANSPDAWVRTAAAETAPALAKLLDDARRMAKAVGP